MEGRSNIYRLLYCVGQCEVILVCIHYALNQQKEYKHDFCIDCNTGVHIKANVIRGIGEKENIDFLLQQAKYINADLFSLSSVFENVPIKSKH